MDFELTDEQRLIQDTVRAFVDERVLPVAVQNDIDHKLDMELIEGMAELGHPRDRRSRRSTAAPGSTTSPRRSPARRSSAARLRSGR